MTQTVQDIAVALSRQHDDQPRLIFGDSVEAADANQWRTVLRHAGVPVLELNHAPCVVGQRWLEVATAFSAEFLMPVVIFGVDNLPKGQALLGAHRDLHAATHRRVDAEDWLHSRQVALTRAVETSPLNQEFRRERGRAGWIRIGWQPDAVLNNGNGLQLAWSSPLPLRRIRDFAARCPEITLVGPDAEAIIQEVAAQGISVTGWRFAVK